MSLTVEDVAKIAELARLELTAVEKKQYQEQLSTILDYAARLDALDLTAVPPTASALSGRAALREDQSVPSLPVASVLFNAPQQQADQFLIQTVLEEPEA